MEKNLPTFVAGAMHSTDPARHAVKRGKDEQKGHSVSEAIRGLTGTHSE